ncbi:Nitroreductase(Nitroreductase-like, 92-220;Nitroreductase-like,374-526) [Magnetospirillum sp. XM-1]|uniref:SagB/ThcOx family dehydrogenase n=1 Tax=Magnetospirillum sp. XM-1 TaxID=1663591 RepID=UPI00073DEE5F|nr:SagB/ThcOx family dehydrogenase [Magnetospirillum sp. XM-1]CUW38172.1 Nitroreductase(Nitroreductase-like, 92-220;Nitroreductase-like,374-526) [Magnetospirillum sp. XM-1]
MEEPLDRIAAYHARTKHSSRRYARGPGFLDWETQPDPFRAFAGARCVGLPLRLDAETPPFGRLEGHDPAPLDAQGLGLFLELALGLSAWKEVGEARWALRNNPSSGNLHPTEGWVILPPLDGIGAGPGLYHYAPFHHGLEERCRLDRLPADLPDGAFLFALSSIPWRESWKYGERAFRYCQHDCGHALAAAAYAAACLGWHIRVLTAPGDEQLAALLGLDRPDSCARFEPEHPDLIAVVSPAPLPEPALPPVTGEWVGEANTLSPDHVVWEVIGQALALTEKPSTAPVLPPPSIAIPPLAASLEPAAAIIRRRRSAQAMDGVTGMGRDAFLRLLGATLPDQDKVPWRSWPWPARVGLMLFVHRVEGLSPGLYALVRDGQALDRLRADCNPRFAWERAAAEVPLYNLAEGDLTWDATQVSCAQDIAGRGAFSLGMLADFDRTLAEDGEWAYRRLFWEAGLIGQVLYLEATAAGLSGTGIGCYHDDEVHDLLGLPPGGGPWQSLYHFTVGGAVEDGRIATRPAYGHLSPAGSPS